MVYVRNRDVCVLHTQNVYLCVLFTYTESVSLCFTYTESVLSKLGASKCTPAGAFFPPKIHLLYFINRESLFLCLRHIQAQLLGSKVVFRVHETLVWNTPADLPDLPDPADPPEAT